MKLTILIIEDEPPVRTALARDLAPFAGTVRIEMAEDVTDAAAAIQEITAQGDLVALILTDHRLPGTTGVDFLVQSMEDERTRYARRVLVTGQAGHEDTVRAVNEGSLDYYVAKPWRAEELHDVVRTQLTQFVAQTHIDPLPYLQVLDQEQALALLRHRPGGAAT